MHWLTVQEGEKPIYVGYDDVMEHCSMPCLLCMWSRLQTKHAVCLAHPNWILSSILFRIGMDEAQIGIEQARL
jgi:hypothetical protein